MPNNDLQHVIEVNKANVFIIEKADPEQYGNKKGEYAFFANGVKVSSDLSICHNTSDFIHLAQIVLSVELVRFVIESTSPKE